MKGRDNNDKRMPHLLLSLGSMVAGLCCFVGYLIALNSIPRGGSEFAYFVPECPRWAHAMLGFTMEQWLAHKASLLWGFPATVLLSVGFARFVPVRRVSPLQVALWSGLVSVGVMAFTMLVVLRGRPIVDDELTYRFQAEQFLAGRMGWDVIPVVTAHGVDAEEHFMVLSEVGWIGKYLFGEGVVQMLGALVGVPALMHLPFAVLALVATWKAASAAYDRDVAGWAVLLTAMSPMFVFTGATGLSHLPAYACVVVAAWGAAEVSRGRFIRFGLVLLGLGIGVCATFRPQVAGPVGLVFGIWAMVVLIRARRPHEMLLTVLVCAPAVIAIGAWNYLATGDPLTMPWSLQVDPESYGFGRVSRITWVHTPILGLGNLIVVLLRLNAWWLGWASSFILFYGALPMVLEPEKRVYPIAKTLPWLVVGLAVVVFNIGYYSPGISETGAIYHFELLLPGCIVGAHLLIQADRVAPRLTRATFIMSTIVGTVVMYGYQGARLSRLAETINGPSRAVLAAVDAPALILVEWHPAHRLQEGWIWSPDRLRLRDPSGDVVTYPRPDPWHLDTVLSAFPGRKCYYQYYTYPDAELLVEPCDQAAAMIQHPPPISPDPWDRLFIVPTSARMGYGPASREDVVR